MLLAGSLLLLQLRKENRFQRKTLCFVASPGKTKVITEKRESRGETEKILEYDD